jgi:D-arabinose 1-dehydrogenase-like Zn-dependent alcohol dehydrogenase
LSSDRSLREYELFHRFETLVSNEVEHSRLKAGDEVAMIGSGPLPITAILLAAAFGIRVTAIERKRLAAATSKEVIKKLKLDGEIKVQFGEGESVVSESASCVLIAVLAQPKESILSNVFRRYMRCATVICRTSYGIRQALYAPTDPSAMKQYTIISQNVAHGNQTISSIVLGKPLISR